MGHCRWNLLPQIPENRLAECSGFPPLIAQLLYNRGLTDPSQFEPFLAGDERLCGDPFLLPDMDRAVTRIYRALLSGEKVAVYGDFDTDGITSTALLVQGLALLGCHAVPYIPHRLTEGYGLKATALTELRQQGVTLVISVDCGITGVAEVKKANRLGLDIIITDHHTPPDDLPQAVAVIDPKLPGSNYPFSELAGVGVALKLLQALFQGLGKSTQFDSLMDLVALGTVADMVPLLGENRYLARHGLEQLRVSSRPGIKEMVAQSGISAADINSDGISWIIAPRLNAAGRLDHAMSSYKLLTTESVEEARELAAWLDKKNAERQTLTGKAMDKAREQVLAAGISPVLIAGDDEFPAGVCGLVASRLVEQFYRPAIVIKTGEVISGGSCRSIPEFNIIEALTRCRTLFTQFGGHAQAAGFSLPTKNLPRLKEALLEVATEKLGGLDLRPRLDIDAEVRLRSLTGNTYLAIQRLAPFGQGNPAPVFLSRGVEVIDCRHMGNNGDHLKLKLKQGSSQWQAVAFGQGSCLAEVSPSIDIVFNLELDTWGTTRKLRLNILDFAGNG